MCVCVCGLLPVHTQVKYFQTHVLPILTELASTRPAASAALAAAKRNCEYWETVLAACNVAETGAETEVLPGGVPWGT